MFLFVPLTFYRPTLAPAQFKLYPEPRLIRVTFKDKESVIHRIKSDDFAGYFFPLAALYLAISET
jgi:hypothetical protein